MSATPLFQSLCLSIAFLAGSSNGGDACSEPTGAREAASKQIVDVLFAKCGDQFVSKLSDPFMGTYGKLQAKGVRLIIGEPGTLTDADRANGVDYRSKIFMHVEMSRSSSDGGKTWGDWAPGLKDTPFGAADVPFDLERRGGTWNVSRARTAFITPDACGS
jgi:hypothetical protein